MSTHIRKPNHRLRRERELRSWTLEQAADALYQLCVEEPRMGSRGDINMSMISRWERGIHPPSRFYQRKLSQLYGKSAEELGFLEPPTDKLTGPHPPLPPMLTGALSHLQEISSPTFSAARAIDMLSAPVDTAPDQQLGAWLALSAQDLIPLFDAGWTPEMVLEALHIQLKGVSAMSLISRRAFGRHLLQLGAATLLSGIPLPAGEHTSAEERMRLHQAFGESIAAGWKLFHTACNAQVLAVGQAELALLQQTHAFLYPQIRSIFYAGVYNLIGRAHHFQEHYEAALLAHMSAHIAALGAGDPWHVAQSLICQSDTYQALGRYTDAIGCIQEALRTLGNVEEEHLRSRAHLLGCWADNAMTMGEYTLSQHKLAESEAYLDRISPKEEFDRTSWLQLAGKRSLMAGDPKQAVAHLEEALAVIPSHWLVRRAGILIPLAIAYARMRERDLSIQMAQQMVPVLVAMNAPMTNKQFAEYLSQDLLGLAPHDEQTYSFVREARHQLPSLPPLIG